MDNPQSRRSRMKRMNLAEIIGGQDSPLSGDTDNLKAGSSGSGPGTEDPTGNEEITDAAAHHNPPHLDKKGPVTLENLSDKIDQILGYLVTNKNELTTINSRHEKRFQILEDAHNEIVERFDLVTSDISTNACQIARNSTNIESNEACISTLKTQLRICKASNEECISKLRDMDLEIKSLKADLADNKSTTLDLGLEV